MKGLSGCKVTINSETVVKEGGARLVKQSYKQKAYQERLQLEGVRVPRVLVITNQYTVMQRAYGKPLLEVMEELSEEQVFGVVNKIVSFINWCKEQRVNSEKDLGITTSKKTGLKTNLSLLEESPCHGDLTLENMMYDDETDTLWLLDFLDSYHEHYLLDLVAPLQNSKLLFHNPISSRNLSLFNDYYEFLIAVMFPEVSEWKDYLLYAKMKRIEPYVNKERKEWLRECLRIIHP